MVDLSQHINRFSVYQMRELEAVQKDGFDCSEMLDPNLTPLQMYYLGLCIREGGNISLRRPIVEKDLSGNQMMFMFFSYRALMKNLINYDRYTRVIDAIKLKTDYKDLVAIVDSYDVPFRSEDL